MLCSPATGTGGGRRKSEAVPTRLPVRQFWQRLLLLWLAGNALRVTVLAVPPVLPAVHRDLRLDETAIGALTALPILLLSAAAVFGSLLVARLGARRVLILGLTVVSVAGAARGLRYGTWVLFVMTIVMGAGVAVSQPTLPSLVRTWFPGRTGIATAAYSNGFLIGETVAAALTVPLVLPLVGQNWRFALAAWSLPVVLTAAGIAILSAHAPRTADAAPLRWWPDWRSGLTWRLGLVLGCASLAYFGSNAFIPDYLKATHQAGLIPLALTSLNLSQVPSSLLTALLPHHLIARRRPLIIAGLITALSACGYWMGGGWVVLWAGAMGFSTALVFVLSLALPPLLGESDDVHRLTAAMFTITYACPFVGSLVGGAIWDATGIPATAFIIAGVAGLLLAALAGGMVLPAVQRGGRGS